MNLRDKEVKVKTHWRFVDAKLSPAWRRLIAKLAASRKEKPTSTGEAAANGENKDEEGKDESSDIL